MENLKEPYDSPYSCYLNLTSRCNLRCRHCFGSYSSQQENELSYEEWQRVIDELVKENVFYVNLSGGEPTQNPFFKEIIKYLASKGLHFIITTNGVFSEDIRNFIIKNKEYLIGIKISLDGPDPESHCFLRLNSDGKENFEIFNITYNNIMFFSKKNVPLTIATVLHKENIHKMEKFRKLIKDINPVSWFISPIIPVGRGGQNKFISEYYDYLDSDFWINTEKEGKNKRINVRLIDVPFELEKEKGYYSCPAALNFCEIHSDGTVSPCTLSRVCIPKELMDFENIKEKNLRSIWHGLVFNEFREYMKKGCKGCEMKERCNKCIAQSFRYFGRGDFPTPFCVKNGEKLGLRNLDMYKEKLKKDFNINI